MKKTFVLFANFVSLLSLAQRVQVSGYTRANGTYVSPYQRSSPGFNSLGTSSTYPSHPVNPTLIWVKGYYKSDGKFVKGYYRTAPDADITNNLSYRVNSSVLNIRSGPSTNYKILGSLSFGQNVEVIETINNHWKKVIVNSTIGYVYSPNLICYNNDDAFNRFLSSNNNTEDILQKDNSNIRIIYPRLTNISLFEEPTSDSRLIETIFNGTPMEMIDTSNNDWIQVRIKKFTDSSFFYQTGYVFRSQTTPINPF